MGYSTWIGPVVRCQQSCCESLFESSRTLDNSHIGKCMSSPNRRIPFSYPQCNCMDICASSWTLFCQVTGMGFEPGTFRYYGKLPLKVWTAACRLLKKTQKEILYTGDLTGLPVWNDFRGQQCGIPLVRYTQRAQQIRRLPVHGLPLRHRRRTFPLR